MALERESQSESAEVDRGCDGGGVRTDGVPSIENSSAQNRLGKKGMQSSSKFLLDQHEEDEALERLSNITQAFFDEDDSNRFLKVYN